MTQPDLQCVLVPLNGPADGAVAECHIGPDGPAEQGRDNGAAEDRCHGVRV